VDALDARKAGFDTAVIEDACRGIDSMALSLHHGRA